MALMNALQVTFPPLPLAYPIPDKVNWQNTHPFEQQHTLWLSLAHEQRLVPIP